MADKISWSNETRKLSELEPWARNPRQINKRQAERLVESFDQFGQVETIAIGPQNQIYNGHQRLKVLSQKYGADYEVDVRIASRALTEKEREKLTVFLHKGAAGSWNYDILANEFELDDLLEWGFEPPELDLDLWAPEPPEDVEPQIDKAEELREKWQVQTGQLWQLGEHRLVCGDCTDKAVVEKVMGGEKAQALISDPPFAVRDDEWDEFSGDEAFVSFTSKWITNGKEYADVVISFMADKNVPLLREAAERASIDYRRALIWRKPPGSQFAGASLDGFWYDFEIIQVFGKPQFKPSKDTKMAVLEYRTVTKQEHGCEKPLGLLEDLVSGYSESGENVMDLFSGTGTVLIACERLGRKCRAVEISPAYCAVAIQRWVDVTGKEPVLLES